MHILTNKDESVNNVYKIAVLVTDPSKMDIAYIQDKVMGLIWSIQEDHLHVNNGDTLQIATPNIDIFQKFGAEIEGVDLIAAAEVEDLLDLTDSLHIFCDSANVDTVNKLCTLAADANVYTVVDKSEIRKRLL